MKIQLHLLLIWTKSLRANIHADKRNKMMRTRGDHSYC